MNVSQYETGNYRTEWKILFLVLQTSSSLIISNKLSTFKASCPRESTSQIVGLTADWPHFQFVSFMSHGDQNLTGTEFVNNCAKSVQVSGVGNDSEL